jgi:hypothetical protein
VGVSSDAQGQFQWKVDLRHSVGKQVGKQKDPLNRANPFSKPEQGEVFKTKKISVPVVLTEVPRASCPVRGGASWGWSIIFGRHLNT